MKSLFARGATTNNFSVLNELKIKICSLGLKVKCNLLGMSGGGKKGSERLSITLHRPILGRHKSKRRLRKIPRTQVLSGLTTVLPLQSVQLIPPRGWCTVCISSPSYSSHYTRLLYLQTLQNIFFFFLCEYSETDSCLQAASSLLGKDCPKLDRPIQFISS